MDIEAHRKLDEILMLVRMSLRGEIIMAADLSTLEATVKANTDATNSALTLIQGLSAQLQAAQNDPTKIQALIDQLNANDTALSAAVTANTPQAPAPATQPAP